MISTHFTLFSFTHPSQPCDPASLCKEIAQEGNLPVPFADKLSRLFSLNPTDKDFQVQLAELCREVSPTMADSLKKMCRELGTQVPAQKTFQALSEAIAVKKKWQELKLNPQWINDSYQDAAYLVKTRLIYSIIGFQNSTLKGLDQNEIKVKLNPGSKQKELWIKKQGEWKPVSQIREEIQWNAKAHALVNRKLDSERWSYFSDQGLMPIHNSYEKQLANDLHYSPDNACMHPVAKLSAKEMDDLLLHAKTFNTEAVALDTSSVKGALQFVTHPELSFQDPCLQNLNAQMKVHCGIRLIMPNGDIYSFGFGGDFQEHLLKSKTSQCLATINGQPKILDYLEFQKYAQRLVTTVPINETQAQEILDQLNFYRANGVRFNVLKQNCVRFGTHLLKIAGISLNTRVSLLNTAWRSLPNVEHLPFIGKVLQSIKQSGKKTRHAIAAKIPAVVKHIFTSLGDLILYIPNLFMNLLLNLGMTALGGKMGSSNSSLELGKNSSSGDMENFDTLVPHLLDSEATYVYHSSILLNWQVNQSTTEVYRYSGQPSMNILPPISAKDKTFSKENKKKLQAVYQASGEVE